MKCLLFIAVLCSTCNCQLIIKEEKIKTYTALGFFPEDKKVNKQAFEGSLATLSGVKITQYAIEPYADNSYSTLKSACLMKDTRPVAVFGPQTPDSDVAIRDLCAQLNIPHLQATWKPPEPDYIQIQSEEDGLDEDGLEEGGLEGDGLEEQKLAEGEDVEEEEDVKFVSLNFYPQSDEIAEAIADLLGHYMWTSFTILYEDVYGLMRIQKILASRELRTYGQYQVKVRKLTPQADNKHTYRLMESALMPQIFKELSALQEYRFLLDCDVENVMSYMEDARAVEMVNDYQGYILTSLDAYVLNSSLIDMETLHANITWLSMINPIHRDLETNSFWSQTRSWFRGIEDWNLPHPKLEAVLLEDMAHHLASALQNLSADGTLDNQIADRPEFCDDFATPWVMGKELMRTLLQTTGEGISGHLEFDKDGHRVNYTLFGEEIRNGADRVTILERNSITKELIDVRPKTSNTSAVTLKKFRVISLHMKPYMTITRGPGGPDNVTIEGFSKDLIDSIFEQLRLSGKNYDYKFIEVDEHMKHGSYNSKTKQWDGLIGELLSKRADLAVCDLTITEERKQVIDFSVPFMNLGIGILALRPGVEAPEPWSFLNPYSLEVWVLTAIAYCVVSVVLFLCARVSTADWENPQPCDKDPEELENIWNFKNCLWLTIGSIMCQGCDILPKAVGTRWVCGMWWFFALIITQTYLAQMSAILTSASSSAPIKNVEDLATQQSVQYGMYESGSTRKFFENSQTKLYQRMWQKMSTARPKVMTESNNEGRDRVLSSKGRYMFFMESTSIDYLTKRQNCELIALDTLLDSKDYGIGMPANSPFRSEINQAILHLKAIGTIAKIKKKWWEEMDNATDCESLHQDKDDNSSDIEMADLVGIFIVLGYGCLIATLITAAEFFNHVRNIVIEEKISHKEAMKAELKSSLNFFQLQKPVLKKKSPTPEDLRLFQGMTFGQAAAAAFMNTEKMF